MHKICFLHKMLLGLLFLSPLCCTAEDVNNKIIEQNSQTKLLQKQRNLETLLEKSFPRDPKKITKYRKLLDEYNQLLHSLYNLKNTPEKWFRYYFYYFELYLLYDIQNAEKHAKKYCHYLENRPTHKWDDEVLHIIVLSDLSRICARQKDLPRMDKYFQKACQEHQILLNKHKQEVLQSQRLQYDAGELLESMYLVRNANYNSLQEWKQAKQCLDEYLSHFKSEKEYAESDLNNGKVFEEQASNCYKLDLMKEVERYAKASITAAEKRKMINLISYLLLAECYYKKEKFADALFTAEQAISVPEGWGSFHDFSNVMEAQLYLLACECCIKLKNHLQKAQKYLDTAEKCSQDPKIVHRIKKLRNEIIVLTLHHQEDEQCIRFYF